tara:strand:- start:81 stop:623 length:543 start_codon:yes stop_codon:yes gene_type:complete
MYRAFILSVFLLFCSKKNPDLIIQGNLSQQDISLALEVHNNARADVGLEVLKWSNTLAKDAQVWANTLANIDKMFHSSNKSRVNQGENLYYSFKTENGLKVYSKTPAKDASASWYNEINEYTYSPIGSPLNKSVVIGHYTQMVWKTTTKVGMAKARSSSGKEYIVARYAPGGNYIGDYPY